MKELIDRPVLTGSLSDNVLRQYVERFRMYENPVQLADLYRAKQCGAFDEIVSGQRE